MREFVLCPDMAGIPGARCQFISFKRFALSLVPPSWMSGRFFFPESLRWQASGLSSFNRVQMDEESKNACDFAQHPGPVPVM